MPVRTRILDHDGITPIPGSILREIITTLGYKLNVSHSGPDGNSDHNTIKGLERTAFMILGQNVMEWERKLANKETYNNESLGRKVFLCFRPLLPKKMNWLHADAILDALRVYEQDEELSFICYGPFYAGFQFNETLFKKRANRYAFIFNTSQAIKNQQYDGSHWIALYIDLVKNTIDYYDSKGILPSSLLIHSISYIIKIIRNTNPNMTGEVNFTRTRKQFGSNECGVYVVHFIVQRLFGKSFQEFNKEFLPDKEIDQYRKIYWTVVEKPLFNYT